MNPFSQLKDLVALFQSADYKAAIKSVLALLNQAVDTFVPGTTPAMMGSAEGLTAEECCSKLQAAMSMKAGEGDAKAFPWQTLLPVLLQFLQTLFAK